LHNSWWGAYITALTKTATRESRGVRGTVTLASLGIISGGARDSATDK
jgi:hypothetical protein